MYILILNIFFLKKKKGYFIYINKGRNTRNSVDRCYSDLKQTQLALTREKQREKSYIRRQKEKTTCIMILIVS